jgi:hypothetical protein
VEISNTTPTSNQTALPCQAFIDFFAPYLALVALVPRIPAMECTHGATKMMQDDCLHRV